MKTVWFVVGIVVLIVLLKVVDCGPDPGKCLGHFAGSVLKGFEEGKK